MNQSRKLVSSLLSLTLLAMVGASASSEAEVTPGHPLSLLPVGSTLELKKDVNFVPHQKYACFQEGALVDCNKVWQGTTAPNCYMTMRETSPRARLLKASASALKVTKVKLEGNYTNLEVESKTVLQFSCYFGNDAKLSKIELAQRFFGDYLKITIAPPDEINPLLEEEFAAEDRSVTDAHSLTLLPVGSTFELKRDVDVLPGQRSTCFQNGKAVECTTVQGAQWQPHCFLWMKETSDKSRRLKAGGAPLKVTKVSSMGANSRDVRVDLEAKAISFLHCVDGVHGNKLPTIGTAKAHLGAFAQINIAPPHDIDPYL